MFTMILFWIFLKAKIKYEKIFTLYLISFYTTQVFVLISSYLGYVCVIYIIYLEVAFSKTGFSWCMVLGFQHAEVPVIKPFMQSWGGAAAPTARLGRL